MDQRIADIIFCCANCTNVENCCGVCGECPACCSDRCADYTNDTCSASAYFDGTNFYKDFIIISQFSESFKIDNIDGHLSGNTGVSSVYDTTKNPPCSVIGMSLSDLDYLFEHDIIACNYSGESYNCTHLRCESEVNPDQPCPPFGGSTSCSTSIDACPSFDKGCSGISCLPACAEYPEECSGSYTRHASSKIIFLNQVKLYGGNGEELDPSVINATYDPCDATRLWGAPGCSFFHV